MNVEKSYLPDVVTGRKYLESHCRKMFLPLFILLHFFPDPLNGSLPIDVAIPIDGNDDEENTIIDHLAASQTSAPRSTASGTLPSTSIQAFPNASTGGAGSKQSNLSAFFMKLSEKVSSLFQQILLDNHLRHLPTKTFNEYMSDFGSILLCRKRVEMLRRPFQWRK